MTLDQYLTEVSARLEHDRGAFDIRNATDLTRLVAIVRVMEQGLRAIAEFKSTSVDKIHLLLQAGGYKDCAAKALEQAEEILK